MHAIHMFSHNCSAQQLPADSDGLKEGAAAAWPHPPFAISLKYYGSGASAAVQLLHVLAAFQQLGFRAVGLQAVCLERGDTGSVTDTAMVAPLDAVKPYMALLSCSWLPIYRSHKTKQLEEFGGFLAVQI